MKQLNSTLTTWSSMKSEYLATIALFAFATVMKRTVVSVFVLLLCFALTNFVAIQKGEAQTAATSIYTDLSAKKCKTLKEDDQGSEQECKGTAGYKLLVLEGDIRQTVTVVTPKGKEFPLELWTVVSPAFSSVGEKAEWRMKNKKPVALIIRFNASENSEDSSKITSYLSVAKITANEICVTDVIKPGANQNELARKAADTAATKQCKKVVD